MCVRPTAERVEQRGEVGVPAHERALVTAHHRAVGLDTLEPSSRYRFGDALDRHPLDGAEQRRVLDQSRGRCGAQNPARVCGRLHPLGHPDGMPDGGVPAWPETDLACDHLTGVHADPNLQIDVVAPHHVGRQATGQRLDLQCGDARPKSVIFECHGRTEQRHQPVAGELVDRPLVSLDDGRRPVEQLVHDFAQPLGVQGGRQRHRPDDVGEEDGDLLAFGHRATRSDG